MVKAFELNSFTLTMDEMSVCNMKGEAGSDEPQRTVTQLCSSTQLSSAFWH